VKDEGLAPYTLHERALSIQRHNPDRAERARAKSRRPGSDEE
jgi:hypothetical protein